MPGDVQLTALQVEPAPLDYVVPPSAMVRVKSVRAEYTDNGAGGDWLPAVQLISDSGHVIATASDQGVKVTAGGSADASFFPGVKHAAVATPAGAAMPYAEVHVNATTWTQPGGTVLSFAGGGKTNNFPSVFTVDLVGSPGQPIVITKPGSYLVAARVTGWNPAWGTNAAIDLAGFVVWGFNTSANELTTLQEPPGFTPAGGRLPTLMAWGVAVHLGSPVSTALEIQADQSSGANRTVGARLFAMQLSPVDS